MKTEITNEQVHQTETYQQALKVAELVVIPELSDDASNYFELLNNYRETTSELNSSGFGRFVGVSLYNYEPDLTEFANNLTRMEEIESNLKQAREQHALIVECVEQGLHKQALEEELERQQLRQAKQEITRNAYKVARAYLEDRAKEQEKRDRAIAKAQAKKTA